MSCEFWFSYRALFVICPDSLFCKLSAILHATKMRRIIMILIRNPVMKKDTPPESQLQLSSISSWKVSGCPRVSESVDNKIHKRVNIGVMLMYAIAFKLYLIRNVAPLLWLLSDALWDCMSKSQGL